MSEGEPRETVDLILKFINLLKVIPFLYILCMVIPFIGSVFVIYISLT